VILAAGLPALGSAVRTGAGKLAARYVYHAVVIDYDISKGTSVGDVVVAVRGVLAFAREDRVRTLAMLLFGAGVGGLGVRRSLEAILETIEDVSSAYDWRLEVEIVVRDEDEFTEATQVFQGHKNRAARAQGEDKLGTEFLNEFLRKK
jgi:O-acetyl-ADP-ribose deacetylase (regulator of RNase III)